MDKEAWQATWDDKESDTTKHLTIWWPAGAYPLPSSKLAELISMTLPTGHSPPATQISLLLFQHLWQPAVSGPLHFGFSLFVLLQRAGLSLTGFRSLLSEAFPSHTYLKLPTLTSVLEFHIFVFCILLLNIIYLYLINCISSIYLFIVYLLNQNASSVRQGHMEPFSCSTGLMPRTVCGTYQDLTCLPIQEI